MRIERKKIIDIEGGTIAECMHITACKPGT